MALFRTAPKIIFEPLHEGVLPPQRATAWSAGYDLRAFLRGQTVNGFTEHNVPLTWQFVSYTDDVTLILPPGYRAMIPLGFKATLPPEYEAQVRARSGNAIKRGIALANGVGTIDADFPDEWKVLLANFSSAEVVIRHLEAVAQMILAKFEVLPFTEGQVRATTTRKGGYGSTGR